MTWDRILETGRGQVAWRVEVEGWSHQWVSHRDMVQSLADGRERILGLSSDDFAFAETIDPIRATWEADGFRVQIAGGGHSTFGSSTNTAAEGFAPPSVRTWLTSDVTDTDTSIPVLSTEGWPDSGVLHLDKEAIRYTSKSATSFDGCTRGAWSTEPTYHYVTTGEDARAPEVTDRPQILEGRRVFVSAYGPGDDKQSSGTQVWFGVALEDVSFDGVSWSFSVAGPDRLLDVALGAGLDEGLSLRGIYYPDTAPLLIGIVESSTSGIVSTSWSAQTAIKVSGFWATQSDFVADLTSWLQDAVTNHAIDGSFSQTDIYAVEDGDTWAIRFVTDSSSPKGMMVFGPGTGPISLVDGRFAELPFSVADGSETVVESVSASTEYQYSLQQTDEGVQQPGTVPRTVLGQWSTSGVSSLPPDNVYAKGSSAWPAGRLYLGGTPDSSATSARVEWTANGRGVDAADAGIATFDVESVDTTNNYVVASEVRARSTDPVLVATAANVPRIGLGIGLGEGTLYDLLSSVTDTARYRKNVPRSASPDLLDTDFDLSTSKTEIEAAARALGYTQSRRFVVWSETELTEIIQQECRLLGVFPSMSASGRIVFRRLRLPSLAEAANNSLTATEILVDGGQVLSYERQALGRVNRYVLHSGYDPVEDEHNGPTVRVQDIEGRGLSPRSLTLEVRPKSVDPPGDVDYGEVVRIAQRIFGTFGGPYAILKIGVPLTHFGVLAGDVVSLTWSKIPNASGGLGVTQKLGYVIGRSWEPMQSRGTLTILATDQRVAGYVPSARISSQSNVSGDQWTVTLDTASYFPTGEDAETHYQVGDKVRVWRWDSASAGTVTGVVDSVSGSDVTVTFDASWTPGADDWVLDYQKSTAITAESQKVYAYEARSTGRIQWSGETAEAFTMAP
jgi:hypothetical protein